MSVAEPCVSQPTPSQITRREKLWAWLMLAILLGVLGVPLYAVYSVSEMITLQPNIEKGGGIILFEAVGPQWLKDWAGGNYDWLVGTPVSLIVGPRQKVSDRWVKRLRGMTRLRTLSLAGTQITDRGMTALANLTELEYLDLSGTDIGDAGLEQIRGLTKLKSLWLDGTQVSDEGLACLAGMNNLSELDLSHTRVRGPGLKCVAAMNELTELNLESTAVDDAGLAQLPALPSLYKLDLGSTKITSAGLRVLTGRPSITSLSIRDTQVDDAAIETLSSLGHLDEYSNIRLILAIQGTKITPQGAHRLSPGISLDKSDLSPGHQGRADSKQVRLQRAAMSWAK
jgi:hypothetical protein